MSIDRRAELAARNNADLYALIFDARGIPFQRRDTHFAALDRPPPYYSDVTVQRAGALTQVGAALDAAMARSGGRASIKDSFQEIERPDLQPLFEATWIWRAVGTAIPDWRRAESSAELAAWEAGWAETSPLAARLFPDALLDRPEIAFLGRWEGEGVVAGCIANLSDGAVGLSNVFGGGAAGYARAADAAAGFGAGRPVVGYERGASLDHAQAAGFACVGGLRVLVGGD